MVHQNAAKLVSLPRSEKFEPTVLAPAERGSSCSPWPATRFEGLFTVAIASACDGEILGLRWQDLDLEAKGCTFAIH